MEMTVFLSNGNRARQLTGLDYIHALAYGNAGSRFGLNLLNQTTVDSVDSNICASHTLNYDGTVGTVDAALTDGVVADTGVERYLSSVGEARLTYAIYRGHVVTVNIFARNLVAVSSGSDGALVELDTVAIYIVTLQSEVGLVRGRSTGDVVDEQRQHILGIVVDSHILGVLGELELIESVAGFGVGLVAYRYILDRLEDSEVRRLLAALGYHDVERLEAILGRERLSPERDVLVFGSEFGQDEVVIVLSRSPEAEHLVTTVGTHDATVVAVFITVDNLAYHTLAEVRNALT